MNETNFDDFLKFVQRSTIFP